MFTLRDDYSELSSAHALMRDKRIVYRTRRGLHFQTPTNDDATLTIIVPVYAGAGNLTHTILSIVKLKYEKYKVVFVSMRPGDAAKKVNGLVQQYDYALKDRYQVFKPNSYLSYGEAMAAGLKFVDTEYFTRIDQGDLVHPYALCSISRSIARSRAHGYLSDRYRMNKDEWAWLEPPRKTEPWSVNYSQMMTLRTQSALDVGGFRVCDIHFYATEWDMAYRLLANNMMIELTHDLLYFRWKRPSDDDAEKCRKTMLERNRYTCLQS
jgi:hypothetical protein